MGSLTGPGLGKFTCSDLATCSLSDLGTVDHGDLSGLGDDDHSLYLPTTGVRSMAGTLSMGSHPIDEASRYMFTEDVMIKGTAGYIYLTNKADTVWRNLHLGWLDAHSGIYSYGTVDMQGHPLTGVEAPTLGSHAANKSYVDAQGGIGTHANEYHDPDMLCTNGSNAMSGTLNMGNHIIDDVSKMGFRDIHDAALITDGTYLVSITNKAESLWGNLALGWLYPRSIYSYGTLNMNYHPIKDPHMDLYGSFAPSKYRGLYISDQTAGTAVAFGDLAYFKSDGKWWDTDADAESTTKGELGMVLETIATNGTGKILKLGYTKNTSWSFGVGSVVYVSCAPGSITTTPPSASGDQVRKVGVAHTGNILYFNPDDTIIEIA